MLSWQVLLVFCVVYFFLAAITAGISVPAGLVVPMLLIGGSYGRLIGLGALSAKKATCADYSTLDPNLAWSDTYYYSTYVRWLIRSSCRMPDPGTYAIVGAASFLGGSGRITVMLATVLLELTDDASMIAPVGICCILSMLVGNAFNHGKYFLEFFYFFFDRPVFTDNFCISYTFFFLLCLFLFSPFFLSFFLLFLSFQVCIMA